MWSSGTTGAAYSTKMELATNKENVYYIAFDPDVVEYAEVTVMMPSDYNGGTVTAAFVWTHPTAATNYGVVWACQGRSYGDGEALDQAWGTAQSSTDTGGTAGYAYISPATSAITLAGTPAASELVQFRVYRDATNGSDTLAVDGRLLGVMITFTRTT